MNLWQQGSKEPEVMDMPFTRLYDMKRGNRLLTLLRSEESGVHFLAVDQIVGSRRIRGALLSEQDIRDILSRLNRQYQLHPAQEKSYETAGEKRPTVNACSPTANPVQLEIEEAIRRIVNKQSIIVIPSLPHFTYRHTCDICGSHMESVAALGPGTTLRICPNCEYAHKAT